MSSDIVELGIGIAGTGIFAQKAHRPALQKSKFIPTAVFSKSAENASKYANTFDAGERITTFGDFPRFLASDLFSAVDIVLPTPIIGSSVRQALAAGKHVLSEKPVAATVEEARDLIMFWQSLPQKPVWLVSENWRLELSFLAARKCIDSGKVGQPLMISCECFVVRSPESLYEHGWRKDSAANGGWLVDIGSHMLAALRNVAGEVNTHLAADILRREDATGWSETISATLSLEASTLSNLALIRAVRAGVTEGFDIQIQVLGTSGRLMVDRTSLQVSDLAGNVVERQKFNCYTVNTAINLFADTIVSGHPVDPENPLHPESALQDLITIEEIRRLL